jgi:hypothetical protein
MGWVLREWQAGFLGAGATAAVMFLIAVSAVHAESLSQRSENSVPLDSPALSQQQGSSGFEDKATGDWWGLRQRLERAGIKIDANLVLEGFKNFHGG